MSLRPVMGRQGEDVMLSSFTVENFKSYVVADIPLSSMTLLMGPNASGKSNALEALRLLKWLSRGMRMDDVERVIQNDDALIRGRIADLFHDVARPLAVGCRLDEPELAWNELRVEIALSDERLVLSGECMRSDSEGQTLYHVDGVQSKSDNTIKVTYNDFRHGSTYPHITCTNQQAIFYQLETPGRFLHNDKRAQEEIPHIAKKFREQLQSVVFLSPNPATMRNYSIAGDDELKEDASNISSVLARLCKHEHVKKSLLEFVCSLPEREFTDISFIRTERNDVMVRLHESFGNKEQKMDAPLLSDGTLRVLALGAALLDAPRGALVVIEEVDNAIHPSRIAFLSEWMRDVASRRGLRVLATTHNPVMLDAIPGTALGDVLCCCRNPKDGDSRIVRLADMKRFPELMARGTLGALMVDNELEQFLKDTTSEEERKRMALSWLRQLDGETDS